MPRADRYMSGDVGEVCVRRPRSRCGTYKASVNIVHSLSVEAVWKAGTLCSGRKSGIEVTLGSCFVQVPRVFRLPPSRSRRALQISNYQRYFSLNFNRTKRTVSYAERCRYCQPIDNESIMCSGNNVGEIRESLSLRIGPRHFPRNGTIIYGYTYFQ